MQTSSDRPSIQQAAPVAADEVTAWHSVPSSEALQRLGTNAIRGLSETNARAKVLTFGPNELPETEARGIGRILWDQVSAMMMVILQVAALVSLAMGDIKDAVVILAIVVLNAGFGFAQEYRAEKAMLALRRLAAPTVKVVRDGSLELRPANQLVPGDIILLETGDVVAADARLLEAMNLQANEAALTGESIPVLKTADTVLEKSTLLPERINMIYLGTSISIGRGRAVVTETGGRTQLGHIAELLGRVEQEQTPLQRRLAELGRGLATITFALVAVIFLLGLARGESPAVMLLTAISMAVAAVPEGLPAVVTIALALGAQRMLRRRALIRRLPAAETLGSVTVICSDKTGTLTENRMAVTSIAAVGSIIENLADASVPPLPAIALLFAAGASCNDVRPGKRDGQAEEMLGDPMEIALVSAAQSAGLDKAALEAALPRVAENPFDSTRKRMTTVHRVSAGLPTPLRDTALPLATAGFIAFTKGALETVLEVCDRVRDETSERPLDAATRATVRSAGERLAQAGQRVLGFAYRLIDIGGKPDAEEHGLVFLGLMGMSDPIRPEVQAAVRSCRAAGIRPVMITGDHPLTARHIARELGIESEVLTGAELEGLSADDLESVVDETSIFARVMPEHKFRIVRALQKRGQVVSMTGDGVNDAPALKQADIGVAMGITGTDASKQAADMVLLDDNFATIVAAIEEGRAIYDNIRKFIRYVLAGNLGELLVMLAGPFFGLPLPLLPLQILWINLVSDGLNGLALSVEPPERDTMHRPPRPAGESIFAGGMTGHILRVGSVMGLISLAAGLYLWPQQHAGWQTAVFLTLACGQAFQTFAVRSWRESVFTLGFCTNRITLLTVGLTLATTLAIVYVPQLQSLFSTVPLSATELLTVLALSTIPFWIIEAEKYLLRRRR